MEIFVSFVSNHSVRSIIPRPSDLTKLLLFLVPSQKYWNPALKLGVFSLSFAVRLFVRLISFRPGFHHASKQG